ncbi:unnamed protein product, partial [marine sediment metagenome]
ILGGVIAEELRSKGFKWQADRVHNHLNRFKQKNKVSLSVSCKISEGDLDTLSRSKREREEVSS